MKNWPPLGEGCDPVTMDRAPPNLRSGGCPSAFSMPFGTAVSILSAFVGRVGREKVIENCGDYRRR